MTSGLVSLMASSGMPSVSSNRTGLSAPAATSSSTFSLVQASMPESSSTPQTCLAKPTGMMPRARGRSWLAQLTEAMRVTPAGTSVMPKACLMLMVSPEPEEAPVVEVLEEPQAARSAPRDTAPVLMRKDLRETDTGPLLR